MKNHDDKLQLSGIVQGDDSCWGGKKHFPRYPAEFCLRFNRWFHFGSMAGILVKAAVNSKPVPQHRLKLTEDWG